MPFLLAEILNFQGSTHHIGVGSFSNLFVSKYELYLPDRRELQKLLDYIMEQDTKEKEE